MIDEIMAHNITSEFEKCKNEIDLYFVTNITVGHELINKEYTNQKYIIFDEAYDVRGHRLKNTVSVYLKKDGK